MKGVKGQVECYDWGNFTHVVGLIILLLEVIRDRVRDAILQVRCALRQNPLGGTLDIRRQ